MNLRNIVGLFLCSATALLNIGVLRAQIEGPLVISHSREAYRAGTQNWGIDMDKKGLIYFGNNKGLLKYDGSEWSLFALPNRTIVRSINAQKDGFIYVGGQNELGRFRNDSSYHMHYESFRHHIPAPYLDFEDVWKTFIIDESIYFCSEKAVFHFYQDTVFTITPPGGRFENYFNYQGEIYLQDASLGLYKIIDQRLEKVVGADQFENDRVVALLNYSDNDIMVTQEQGIFLLRDSILEKTLPEVSLFTSQNKAYTAMVNSDEELLVGTVQNGLAIIDKSGSIKKIINKKSGLGNNTVLCAYEDPQKNIWLGLDNGLAQVEVQSPYNFISSQNGIEGTGYASFLHDGSIYLGTNQGLFKEKENGAMYERFSNKLGQVWSSTELNGTTFIHAHEGMFALVNDELLRVSEVGGSWKVIKLNAFENLYLQGAYNGFYLYSWDDLSETKLTLIGKLEGFNESSRIFQEDDEGAIWVSHAYRGLYRLKLSNDGRSIDRKDRFGASNGLPNDYYITVSKIRDELVFATTSGVYQFNTTAGEFNPHETLNSLIGSNENVKQLIEDEKSNVWFCTDNEFGRIAILPSGLYNDVEITFLNEIQEDLVDGFEAVFMLDDQTAFIPIESGFIKFNTDVPLRKEFSYTPLIEGLFTTEKNDSLLGKFSHSQRLKLPADFSDLKFKFVAPNYQFLNTIKYQYRLIGLNEEWSDWTPSTHKEYNNLNAGLYRFELRAMNSFQTVTEPIEFKFYIMPPWHSTTLAKIIYVLLILGFLFGLYYFVKRREKQKRLRFEQESTKTIKEKETQLQMVAEKSENEIIKLKNEKLRADIKHKNAELASTTMHLVQKSEILQKLKGDLKDLEKDANDNLQRKIKQIERTIDSDVRLDKNWEKFESHFDQVHENFFQNLREQYPELTPKDQKLCAYLRMNLSTKEIAPLLNISVRGVEISRYRLRKKLDLSSEENLVTFIMDI